MAVMAFSEVQQVVYGKDNKNLFSEPITAAWVVKKDKLVSW